jgi:hypothetical protein
MHCPSCSRPFGYIDSFRILNPLKYECPSCGLLLTAGRFGKIAIGFGCFLGLLIVAVAIFMEESRLWATRDSLMWFAVSVPLAGLPWQWYWWRKSSFTLRQSAKL